MEQQLEGVKACPLCGEQILEVAIKCKHCGSDLNKGQSVANASKLDVIGLLMLMIPAIAIFLIWLWIGNMSLVEGPRSSLSIVGIGMSVLTAILAAYESQQAGSALNGKKATNAIVYFFGMILMWIVFYPIYMYQRKYFGKKNMVVGALLIVVILLGSSYFVHHGIGAQTNQVRSLFGNL